MADYRPKLSAPLPADEIKEEVSLVEEVFKALKSVEAKDRLYDLLRSDRCRNWLGISSEEELIELVYREEREKVCANRGKPYISGDGTNFICPADFDHHVIKRDIKDGLPRYRCTDCNKNYTALYGSLLYKKGFEIATWYTFIDCMFSGLSTEETGRKCNISPSTANEWRLRLFYAVEELMKDVRLCGNIEVDETYIPLSYKGKDRIINESVFRSAHKRGKQTRIKDLQKDQACIVCAVDSHGNCFAKVAGIGMPTASRLVDTIADSIDYDRTEYFITDGEKALAKFADLHGLHHLPLISRHVDGYGYLPAVKKIDGVKYSVQHINAFHSSLSKFLRDFGGVSTKYLQGYLYLFTYKYSRGSSLFTPSAYLDILKMLVRPGHYLPADELKERYQTLVSHSIGNKKLTEFSPIQIEMYARYTKGEDKVDICAEFEIAEKEFDKLIKQFETDERTANLAVRWYEREKEELIKEREHLQKALDRQRRKESILADYDDGMTMREIAPKYGITFQRVGQIIKDEKEKGWVTKRPVYIPKVKIKKVRPRRRTIEDKLFKMYQELREKKPKATQAQIATLIAEELGRPIPSVNAMISAARIKRGEKRKRTIVPQNTIPKIIADFENRCKESTPEHPLTYQIIHKELAIKYGIKFSTIQGLLIRHYQEKGQKAPELSYRKPMPMSEVRKCRTNYDSNKKIPDRIRRKILEQYKLRMKSRGYKPERNPLRAELAKEFGVTKTTIARITRNERQKFIQEQESED